MSASLLTVFEPAEDESSRRINNGNNNDNDNSVQIQIENNSIIHHECSEIKMCLLVHSKVQIQALINVTVRYNRGESKSIQLG